MASVFRVTAVWSGFLGAPGYTKFSFLNVVGTAGAGSVTNAARTFINSFAAAMPSGTTVQVAKEVGEYDEVTGQLIGELSATATPAPISGLSVAKYVGGSGLFIGWRTGAIWQGRRVIGRTFIVPQESTIFDTNGTLVSATLASAQSAADAFIADSNSVLGVWSRIFTTDAAGKPHQTNGAAFQATTAYVRDQASGLRSRRG